MACDVKLCHAKYILSCDVKLCYMKPYHSKSLRLSAFNLMLSVPFFLSQFCTCCSQRLVDHHPREFLRLDSLFCPILRLQSALRVAARIRADGERKKGRTEERKEGGNLGRKAMPDSSKTG